MKVCSQEVERFTSGEWIGKEPRPMGVCGASFWFFPTEGKACDVRESCAEWTASRESLDKKDTKISVYAQTADTYFDSGKEKYDNKDYKGAIEDLNKAIEINPKYAEAYSYRGLAKAKSGDFKGAIEDFNKAIEINPNDAEAYYNRGGAKILLGQKDDGCLDYSKAAELGNSQAYEQIKKYCN